MEEVRGKLVEESGQQGQSSSRKINFSYEKNEQRHKEEMYKNFHVEWHFV